MTQPIVFLSYSHKDENEKNELLDHLGVLWQAGLLEVWSDDRIGAGEDWKQRIQEAMQQARLAILLISANFLTSDFILNQEVPTLLKRRREEGLVVFPIIAKACAWKQFDWLVQMNVRPKNNRPIWGRDDQDVDEALALIAEEVAEMVKGELKVAAVSSQSNSYNRHNDNSGKRPPLPKVEFAAYISPPPDKTEIFEDILQRMFTGCQRVFVAKEFTAGSYSGSWVFLVERFRDRAPELPVVVKFASLSLIEKEWQAYQQHIKDKWAAIAPIKAEPILAKAENLAGLYYAVAGDGIFPVTSLRAYCLEAGVDDIKFVLAERLASVLERGLTHSKQRYKVRLQALYDPVLPVNLLLEPGSVPYGLKPTLVKAGELAPSSLTPGDYVRLENFVVTKVDAKDNTVTLNLPHPDDDLPNNAYTVRLKYAEGATLPAYTIGQALPAPVDGQVLATRRSQWADEMKKVMAAQPFDLAGETISLSDGTRLPNPLVVVPEILDRHLDLKVFHIHGDLNLENILIDPKVRDVRLIDFSEARWDHVLHDFFRLETEVVTKLIPPALAEADLPVELIRPFYEQLHCANFHAPPLDTARPPDPALEKAFEILRAIRRVVRDYGLFDPRDFSEYYDGLTLYLLGALKFRNLDDAEEAPLPKQLAFWGAATIQGLLKEDPCPERATAEPKAGDPDIQPDASKLTPARGETPMTDSAASQPTITATGGSIVVGDVTGSYTAIGHGAHIQVNQAAEADPLARLFGAIDRQIESRPPDRDVDNDELISIINNIRQEIARGEQTNENKLTRWLNTLIELAPDIGRVLIAGLQQPDAGVPPPIRQIAAQVGRVSNEGMNHHRTRSEADGPE
jgi:hypothetical protein